MFGRHVAYSMTAGQQHEIGVGDAVAVLSRFGDAAAEAEREAAKG